MIPRRTRTPDGAMPDDGAAHSPVEAGIARWRAAGIIDEDQAARIRALEHAWEQEEERGRGRAASARPGLQEAVVYLGLAVAGVGVIALTAQHWDDLSSAVRVIVWAAPGLLALLLGAGLRRMAAPQLVRATGMAWLAAVLLLFFAVSVAGGEAGWGDPDVFLVAGAAATVLAAGLWMLRRATPQIIALAWGLAFLAEGIAAQRSYNVEYGEGDPLTFGMLLMAFGAAWIVLAETGALTPRLPVRALGAAALVWGPFMTGFVSYSGYPGYLWAQLLVFVAAGALVALSLRRASFTYMLAGVAGAFIGLVAFIFKHFEDEIGAPVALILSGALLVAAALLLAAFRARLGRPSMERFSS
jgi:hypothetical protein